MKHSMKLALVLALALGGCGNKEEPTAAEAPSTVPEEPKAVAEETPAPELSPEEPSTEAPVVAVPEDFEEEAARTVKLENLDAELDRLEAEIEG
jgi:hypothetical protein